MINQYDNPVNADAHYATTGPEIWRQMDGRLDYFVASGSTGGTITGTGRYLKEQDPAIKVVMPDPVGSIYYTYFKTGEIDENEIGTYQVEGIGEDHIAKCMDFSRRGRDVEVHRRGRLRPGEGDRPDRGHPVRRQFRRQPIRHPPSGRRPRRPGPDRHLAARHRSQVSFQDLLSRPSARFYIEIDPAPPPARPGRGKDPSRRVGIVKRGTRRTP